MDVITLFQARRLPHLAGVATVVAAPFMSAPALPASADPCPDVEVVFARGTSEPPGVGMAGRALVDALQAQAGNKSVAVYPVNYAASSDFGSSGLAAFSRLFVYGIGTSAWCTRSAGASRLSNRSRGL